MPRREGLWVGEFYFASSHFCAFLDCSQAWRYSTMKCVTLGSFHWRFTALEDLVSSDKLQSIPKACPNLFNFTPCYSLGRLKLLWWCGQSGEVGLDSDLCLKLSRKALSSLSESLCTGSSCSVFSTKFAVVRPI